VQVVRETRRRWEAKGTSFDLEPQKRHLIKSRKIEYSKYSQKINPIKSLQSPVGTIQRKVHVLVVQGDKGTLVLFEKQLLCI
jgi:hypothetical protein